MSFNAFEKQTQGVQLLQRSLARGRLGHAYLFAGNSLETLQTLARTLAKTLNCLNPVKIRDAATDCCDECSSCRKIENGNHADVLWIRPESRSRQIKIEQIARRAESPARVVNEFVSLKPTEGKYKAGVIVAADRMTAQATNSFLKTLEEPPQNSVLILLSTEPQRLLETILSRCLRLNFSGEGKRELNPDEAGWLEKFGGLAASEQKSLLGRYRLLDALLQKLAQIRSQIDEKLAAGSPLEKYDEVEKDLREKWEDELAAAIESEYRRRRADLLLLLQFWLRDVWLHSLAAGKDLLNFPRISGAETIAKRISSRQALENLQTFEQTQRLLHGNVQEALALEVGLLKLHF